MKDSSDRNRRRRGRCASSADESSELFFGSGSSGGSGGRRRDHKTAQLCRQVFWALSMALGDCADDVLRELVVVDVTPAPDAGRLLVRVGFSAGAKCGPAGTPLNGVVEVMGRLEQARGFLRREVAGAITRKRAPELMFVLVADGGEAEGARDTFGDALRMTSGGKNASTQPCETADKNVCPTGEKPAKPSRTREEGRQ